MTEVMDEEKALAIHPFGYFIQKFLIVLHMLNKQTSSHHLMPIIKEDRS